MSWIAPISLFIQFGKVNILRRIGWNVWKPLRIHCVKSAIEFYCIIMVADKVNRVYAMCMFALERFFFSLCGLALPLIITSIVWLFVPVRMNATMVILWMKSASVSFRQIVSRPETFAIICNSPLNCIFMKKKKKKTISTRKVGIVTFFTWTQIVDSWAMCIICIVQKSSSNLD